MTKSVHLDDKSPIPMTKYDPLKAKSGKPNHRECYTGKSAGKYLFPMTRPDPKKSLEKIDKRHINMI